MIVLQYDTYNAGSADYAEAWNDYEVDGLPVSILFESSRKHAMLQLISAATYVKFTWTVEGRRVQTNAMSLFAGVIDRCTTAEYAVNSLYAIPRMPEI